MTFREAQNLIEKNENTTISKEYVVSFLFRLFTLDVFSEDRENGEHKHFITVSFLKFRFINICYRTGMNNCYVGTASKRNLFVAFMYGVWDWMQNIFYKSESVYRFLDKHNFYWLVKNRYYNGRRLDVDTAIGISSAGVLSGYRDIEWKNNGFKCVLTVDVETERLMREGSIYNISGDDSKSDNSNQGKV